MTNEPKWIEAVERIVILYANLSGRETANRAEFRKKVEVIIQDTIKEERERIYQELCNFKVNEDEPWGTIKRLRKFLKNKSNHPESK